MSRSDFDPEQAKDSRRFQTIHETAETARQAIMQADFASRTDKRSEVEALKRAHSATVGFFLLLEPDIRHRGREDLLTETRLGFVRFGEDTVEMIVGLEDYATRPNPVTKQVTAATGTYTVRRRQREVSELIPLPVIRTAFSQMHNFAYNENLLTGDTVEDVHGDPW